MIFTMKLKQLLRLLFCITVSLLIAGCSSQIIKDPNAINDGSETIDTNGDSISQSEPVLNGDTEFFGLSNLEKLDSTQVLLEEAIAFQNNGDAESADRLFESALELIYDIDQNDPEIDPERYENLKEELDNRYSSFLEGITEFPAESSPDAVITGIGIAEDDTISGEDVFEGREGITDTLALDSLLASVIKLPPVPIDNNKKVEKAISFFQGKGRKVFEKWMERAEVYVPMFQQILREEGLPEELVYLSMIESGFNPKAYSYAHAAGPWQFIRSTGRIFGLKIDWWYDERRDPVKSTLAACDYLKRLYTEFNDWYLALAAYNCGEGRINRHIRRYNTKDYWELRRLPRQTRNYVPTYLAAVTIMQDPEKYGFQKISYKGHTDYDSVLVTECLDLNLVADIINADYQSLKDLNPAIVRWCTPPTMDSVWLKVPLGTTELFQEKVTEIPEDQKRSWVRHKVRTGETLSMIAQKYRTSMKAIMDIKSNNIRSPHRIGAGKYLLIPVPPNKYGGGAAFAAMDYDEEYIPDGRSKITYTVRKGDNLGLIARKYGTSVKNLKSWNNLWNKRFIYPGQKLQIYVRDSHGAPVYSSTNLKVTPNGKVHVVRSGESLWSISNIYKLSLEKLKALNGFTGKRAVIHPGDEIKLYDEGEGGQTAVATAQPVDNSAAESDNIWNDGLVSEDDNLNQNENNIHIVQRGESLWSIAQKYNLEVNVLKRINGLTGRAIVYPGDKINLYNQGMDLAGFATHVVRRGDTLWDIANSYGIDLGELKRVNGINGGTLIKPGDKIKIPVKG